MQSTLPLRCRIYRVVGTVFIGGSLVTTTTVSARLTGSVVQHAMQYLSTGKYEQVVPLFRYFEESVSQSEVSEDKRAIHTFFVLLRKHFGRLDRVSSSLSTSPNFINVYIESATPDLWRNSGCAFNENAFKSAFTDSGQSRAAEILLTTCFDNRLQREWLRKIDIRFTNTNPDTIKRAQEFLIQFSSEMQRVPQ